MRNVVPSIMLRHGCMVSFFGVLLLLCQLLVPTVAIAATNDYVIVLASASGRDLDWGVQQSHLFKGRTVYIEQTILKKKPWEQLCLGYFGSYKQAAAILDEIQQTYPGAWIKKTSVNVITRIVSASSTAVLKKNQTSLSKTSSLTEKQLDSLMLRAKTDFKKKNYSSSIRYLNALIDAGDHQYSQESLELLGLARQRKGQNAHAVKTYEEYLALYPDAEGSDRVRQRLAGLQTATQAPGEELQMATIEDNNALTTHGSLSQFYQNNSTAVDDVGNITTLSQLITFFDITALHKTSSFDHRYQFTSDHVYDFISSDFISSGDSSEFRFIETYYELSYRKTGSSGRLGRQRLLIGGILKRFDGLSVGYQINPNLRLNILGGFPVDFDNKTSINKHKTFYGFTFETGTFLGGWNMNLFYFDQENDGLTDGRSLGTEVRYRDKKKLLYGLVDYDLFYEEINILQLNVNVVFDQGRTVYVNAFLRQSPLLSTDTALLGRQEQSIEELKKVLNIEQIYQLARDRTANNETLTIGGSQPLSEKFQLTADITFAHTGDTVASGGVPATLDTGTEYYISTLLVSNGLLMKNDTNVLGVRYYDTEPTNIISFVANSRFSVTRNWRLNPRLQYDIRTLNNDQSRKMLRAILRTDYRYLNNVRFDFEIGYDKNSGENVGRLLGSNSLFFTLGYRWDF